MANRPQPPNQAACIRFLEDDFKDALRWMMVGALANQSPERHCNCDEGGSWTIPNLEVLGQQTSLVQARALYAFFTNAGNKRDDARADHFMSGPGSTPWTPGPLIKCEQYLSTGKPANKRIFHLVYGREQHSGGTATDESDHIKNQVVPIAQELFEAAEAFAAAVDSAYEHAARGAVDTALFTTEAYATGARVENLFTSYRN